MCFKQKHLPCQGRLGTSGWATWSPEWEQEQPAHQVVALACVHVGSNGSLDYSALLSQSAEQILARCRVPGAETQGRTLQLSSYPGETGLGHRALLCSFQVGSSISYQPALLSGTVLYLGNLLDTSLVWSLQAEVLERVTPRAGAETPGPPRLFCMAGARPCSHWCWLVSSLPFRGNPDVDTQTNTEALGPDSAITHWHLPAPPPSFPAPGASWIARGWLCFCLDPGRSRQPR